MHSTKDIRNEFISHFVKNDHEHISSYPLVPQNDPSLMFTNSGMVQFKDFFTGKATPPYPRAVTCQKCLRAGGKHNDLDNVGYTARHHTFFEMLGNFSFGDYFKEQAILEAYTLIVKNFAIPSEKLWITVYHDDDEAFNLWKKIANIPENRIVRITTNDNFWQMGNTGPCGPCSEIFYDYGEHVKGGPPGSKDEDGDRFTEIWNLVFMQFEQFEDKPRVSLPKPSVDTGMGLERIASVLQGKQDNYDTDQIKNVMEFIADTLSLKITHENKSSIKVIFDHARAACFMIADGISPSNEGRGYVLRRIMRRGMSHAHMIGAKEPIMHKILPLFIAINKDVYPELDNAKDTIENTLFHEEERFNVNLERGLKILNSSIESIPSGKTLDGKVAFKLYDTYGFPLDMTVDILRRQNLKVSVEEFDLEMKKQKDRARKSWKGSGNASTSSVWFEVRSDIGKTEFLGYQCYEAQSVVRQLLNEKLERVDSLKAGEKGFIMVGQTPFYATSGGQEGDRGVIFNSNDNAVFKVKQTYRPIDELWVHEGIVRQDLSVNNEVRLEIDTSRREQLARHHSATHLLHAALRDRLGSHVSQKGSLVEDSHLRFDFAHNDQLSDEDILAIEDFVTTEINLNSEVLTVITSPTKAREKGALALFGEKYGDTVRMVSIGEHSLELCGGTHVKHSAQIGCFKILKEQAVASGVRRIEAICGDAILNRLRERERKIDSMEEAHREEKHKLLRKIEESSKKLALLESQSEEESVKENINGIEVIARKLKDIDPKHLKNLAQETTSKHEKAIVLLANIHKGRVTLVVSISSSIVGEFSAVDIIENLSHVVGAKKGGGRDDLAQTGGDNVNDLDKVFSLLLDIVRKHFEAEKPI